MNQVKIDDWRRKVRKIIRNFENLSDLDHHYAVLRRDRQHRFIIVELLQKSLSVLIVSINRFLKDACNVSASALTFYSILSFIPIVALAFAIAKGFGVGTSLEELIKGQFPNNADLASTIVEYANSAIANAKGGVVTGFGIVILLWAVIKVLNSTELTMNRIWGIRKGRSIRRMFTDYLSIIFIVPILIILISSLNVFMGTDLKSEFPVLGDYLLRLFKFLPYLLVWMLFIFLYMFMPAAPVKFKHAFIAGMVAGTVYQIVQWFYIRFQIGVTSYNAIYGSLAALPLLLVWLQLSWCVVLWGTELCYILRNRHFMYKNELIGDSGWMETMEHAIRVVKYVAKVYVNNEGGPSLTMINKEMRMNTGKLRLVLEELIDRHILVVAKEDDDYYYYPASDFHRLSVAEIILNLSRVEESKDQEWKEQFSKAICAEFSANKLA